MLLHYYLGSMYAGKSTHAVNALIQSGEYQKKIIASPSSSSRGYLSRNHNNNDLPSSIEIFANLNDISIEHLQAHGKTLLVIDEVQFCEDDHFWQIIHLANKSDQLDLIVAGLQVGQHAQPFPNNEQLLSLFNDKITRIYAPCAICADPNGLVAVRKWLINDHIRDEYSLMCKECFGKFFNYARGDQPLPNPAKL